MAYRLLLPRQPLLYPVVALPARVGSILQASVLVSSRHISNTMRTAAPMSRRKPNRSNHHLQSGQFAKLALSPAPPPDADHPESTTRVCSLKGGSQAIDQR